MKKIYFIALVLGFHLWSCTSQLSPEEADRSMKILNGNLVNLMSTGSEKPEFKALKFLMTQASCPLPYVKKGNSDNPDTVVYRFEPNKGNYHWNPNLKAFEKTSENSIVELNFPSDKSAINDLIFKLNNYESQPYSSRPDFPTQIDAVLNSGENELLKLTHHAIITDKLPEQITAELEGSDYSARFEMNRTRLNKSGELHIETFLKTKGIKIISGTMDSQIEYGKRSYFFKTIRFNVKLIDHTVSGEINYSAIDPMAKDYVDSFNSNSDIIIKEGQKVVGKIILNKTNNNELLDYFVRFSNGHEIALCEYIPALKNLLNLKY